NLRLRALRMYDSYALKISGVIGKDIDPPDSVFGDSLIGTWYGAPDGSTSYEVIVPPTGIVWSTTGMACDALAWIVRHVIERVQTAARRQVC
ncbi:MAG: hypothetical protein OK454_07710, partial [Thaumarchaeota archaeon]|nr:hypothetical protein [Nitrososphaerota archaeon]